jgi:transcriptional/translational regulatory protein YebC/TACO1
MGRAFEFRKGRKMKRWSAMAKAFTRIGNGRKEGGPNPEANSRLEPLFKILRQ